MVRGVLNGVGQTRLGPDPGGCIDAGHGFWQSPQRLIKAQQRVGRQGAADKPARQRQARHGRQSRDGFQTQTLQQQQRITVQPQPRHG